MPKKRTVAEALQLWKEAEAALVTAENRMASERERLRKMGTQINNAALAHNTARTVGLLVKANSVIESLKACEALWEKAIKNVVEARQLLEKAVRGEQNERSKRSRKGRHS